MSTVNAPAPSLLDGNQILQHAFDEETGRLRTDSVSSIVVPGGLEVDMDSQDDSVAIGDTEGNLVTTSPSQDDPDKQGLDVNILNGITGTLTQSGLSTGLRQMKVMVGDEPTPIPLSPLMNRNGITIRVWGDKTVYFGNETVTSGDGYPKNQYEEIQMDVKDNSAVFIYATCAPGETSELRILEVA